MVEANKTGKTISGLENGVAGLGIRGIAPIAWQEQHLGSVEFGMNFNQKFFEEIKQKHQVEIALFIPKDGALRLYILRMASNLYYPMRNYKRCCTEKQWCNMRN